MSKFNLKPAKSKRKWNSSNIVSTELEADLIEPFRELQDKSNMMTRQLLNQMIRHCLTDMGLVKSVKKDE